MVCGFSGLSSFTKDITNIVNSRTFLSLPNVIFDYNKKEPTQIKYNSNTYVICYIGNLYNTNELKKILIENGFTFETDSSEELLVKAFIFYGHNVVNVLNGIFSFVIWNNDKKELFLARDHFGVKPLYYSILNDTLIFASEIKSILSYPNFKAKVNNEGFCELFGLGPAHTPGICAFENIFELKPAHFAIYNSNGFNIKRYWKLESKPHTDSFEETCNKVKLLLEDSIKSQLVSDVPLCTFLSGGLDSSIITTYANKYYKENNLSLLATFSVDYIDNDKNFVKSDFQPNSDKYYIDIMTNLLRHKTQYYIYRYS